MTWLADPGLDLAAALTLAVILVGAAVSKLAVLDEFAGVIANYRVLPDWPVLQVGVARMIPVLEIAGGVGLLVPATRLPAAALVLGLLIVFSVALAINLLRGRTWIDCGCFRHRARQPITWTLVARNGVLIALDGLVIAWGHARATTPLDLVTAAGAALALAMLYAATPMLSRALLEVHDD